MTDFNHQPQFIYHSYMLSGSSCISSYALNPIKIHCYILLMRSLHWANYSHKTRCPSKGMILLRLTYLIYKWSFQSHLFMPSVNHRLPHTYPFNFRHQSEGLSMVDTRCWARDKILVIFTEIPNWAISLYRTFSPNIKSVATAYHSSLYKVRISWDLPSAGLSQLICT